MSIYGVKGCSRNCIALLYGMLHHTRHYFSYIMATGAPSIDHKCLTLYQIQTICKINIIKYLKIVFERIENIERNGENVGYQYFVSSHSVSKGSFLRIVIHVPPQGGNGGNHHFLLFQQCLYPFKCKSSNV